MLLLFLFVPLACQEGRKRATPAPAPAVESPPTPSESEPPILKDEALTLANLKALQQSEGSVLYLVPVKLPAPEAQRSASKLPSEPPLQWLMTWGRGKTLDDWRLLPRDYQEQIELFQRTWKKHPQPQRAPIQSVIAYRDDMALEEIGAMHDVLKGTCKNLELSYYQAFLSKVGELKFELPDTLDDIQRAR